MWPYGAYPGWAGAYPGGGNNDIYTHLDNNYDHLATYSKLKT